MIRKRLAIATATALVAATGWAAAATFGLQPKLLTLDAAHPIAQLSFSSVDPRSASFDTALRRWKQTGGADVFEDAAGIVVIPPMFSVKPYDTQLLRVAFRDRPGPPDVETAYEIAFTEIVPPGSAEAARIFNIPLFVPARTRTGEVTYRLHIVSGMQAQLIVANASNRHAYIGKLTISSGGKSVYAGDPAHYVLAGNTWGLPLRLSSTATGSEAQIEIENEEGTAAAVKAIVSR